MSDCKAWCSWCYDQTDQKLIKKNIFSRNQYQCLGCGNYTIPCRICSNMARYLPGERKDESLIGTIGENWANELCAEHNWTIVRFLEKGLTINGIDDYEEVLNWPDDIKIPKILKSSEKALPFYRPRNFRMREIVKGKKACKGPVVISISGFLSEREEEESGSIEEEWQNPLENTDYFKQKRAFRLHWDASRRADFFGTAGRLAVEQKVRGKREEKTGERKSLLATVTETTTAALAAVGSKAAGHAATLMVAKDLVANPWYLALLRAKATGKVLAHILNRTVCPEGFILVGHSLGARIIYYTLQALKNDPTVPSSESARIRDIFLFGGAVSCKDDEGWNSVLSCVEGTIYNFYADKDFPLHILYRASLPRAGNPIGIRPISLNSEQIQNFDVSHIIKGHNEYIGKIPHLINYIESQKAHLA